MKKNDLCEIRIEDMGKDGEGIGHVDGMTIFVKDTVVGDWATVKLMKVKKNMAFARLMEILEPSPYRVTPVCEAARACGGCTLQHISYEKQKELKQKHVLNCLTRIGGLSDVEEKMEPLIGMEDPFHYRNKMQFPVGLDAAGCPQLGFYAGRTHSLIPLTDCPVGHPVNRVLLAAFREYLSEAGVKVYDEESHSGLARHLLTRVGFATGEVMVCVVINGRKLPKQELLVEKLQTAIGRWNMEVEAKEERETEQGKTAKGERTASQEQPSKAERELQTGDMLTLASVTFSINEEKTNRILGDRSEVIFGKGYIEDRIGSITFRISPESFFQVNPVQTVRLYGKALEYAGLTGSEVVWDMYCGIGTISLFLAEKAKKVFGVEIVPQAIQNAKENAERNQIGNAEFFVGKAEDVVPRLYAEDPEKYRADVVVVDPPRKGCDAELLTTLLSMAPDRIVYVSCDPATLARDIKILGEGGYAVEKVTPVDMFPGSMHVESVALLHMDQRIAARGEK
ncbi:MAG: 23S rRNA (uracil(1939)-C(5))-methyltransferase RlmD [Eubacterium sp.]|nr:23S rRNA (uracil(1939)-C(5))-methyltransferase RlmD [Eubacterium sp.]